MVPMVTLITQELSRKKGMSCRKIGVRPKTIRLPRKVPTRFLEPPISTAARMFAAASRYRSARRGVSIQPTQAVTDAHNIRVLPISDLIGEVGMLAVDKGVDVEDLVLRLAMPDAADDAVGVELAGAVGPEGLQGLDPLGSAPQQVKTIVPLHRRLGALNVILAELLAHLGSHPVHE